MPAYRLTYFEFPGIAEPIRYLLAYSGKSFEDIRLGWESEEWKKLKPTTPYGVLPLLEIEGVKKPLSQHVAISRYLGKQLGLAGDNDLEAAEIDSVADAINDFKSKLYEATLGEPEIVKKNYAEAIKTTIPFFLDRLNTLAKNGYLANGKLSWVDIYFAGYIKFMNLSTKFTVVEKYPNLKRVQDNVLANPNVKAWVDAHP